MLEICLENGSVVWNISIFLDNRIRISEFELIYAIYRSPISVWISVIPGLNVGK